MLALVFPGEPPSHPVKLKVRASGALSSTALKLLRTCSPTARELSPTALKDLLGNGGTLVVGDFPEYRSRELAAELASTGLEVTSSQEQ